MSLINVGETINTGLSYVAKIFNTVRDNTVGYYGNMSLPEATKLTRVEPVTIVSRDLLNKPETRLTLNSLLSMFTAYYLQAVDILTKVEDVEVVRLLDKLNPDRDETGFLLSERLSRESYDFLATEEYRFRLPTRSQPALEAEGNDRTEKVDLDTIANLSVGRLVNVRISYTKQAGLSEGEARSITIPVSVRLMVSSIPSDAIARIMTYKNQDLSLIERIHSARSGRIEFIKDLIFCQDLINEYKKANIQDPTNALAEITRRANNAKKWGLATRNPSLVAASSLFVISSSVAREIESKLGGKLESARIREKAFENTYAMIVAVVDPEWETVTFYTRGIARGTTVGFKELEGKTKGSGPDIGDILKAMTSGQPPSF